MEIHPIGTPYKHNAIKVLMLGSGELGKEVVIEFQRLGVEVIAVDRYAHAPAMQVAHRQYVINMLDAQALKELVRNEKPHYIVPEVEAIATQALLELEEEGFTVIPTARATHLTMNREGIRTLVSKQLQLKTSAFQFAGSEEEFVEAVKQMGIPCVVKPIMSSSGKGQSIVRSQNDVSKAWQYAQEGGRAGGGRVIIEAFVPFDYEITLLTVKHASGVSFCAPIGHRQEHGDYQESWQPHPMPSQVLAECERMAAAVVNELGGRGIFGVEFFIKGEEVYFSELSPRPHDTGMVTLISQDLSEFALHVRAILGLPIPNIQLLGPSASHVILVKGTSDAVSFTGLEAALAFPNTQVRLFGKPNVDGERRMGVCLARAESIEKARMVADNCANLIHTKV